jgi:hypothetical protein
MTDQTLSNDLVRQFGFSYTHDGKTNVLICNQCEKLFRDLKDKLSVLVQTETCSFFDNCGKEEENGDKGKQENG